MSLSLSSFQGSKTIKKGNNPIHINWVDFQALEIQFFLMEIFLNKLFKGI